MVAIGGVVVVAVADAIVAVVVAAVYKNHRSSNSNWL